MRVREQDRARHQLFGADEVEELRDLITWVDGDTALAGAFTGHDVSVFLEGGAAAVSRIMHVGYRNGPCCRRRPVVSLEDLDCCEANRVVIRAATTAEAAMATVQAERPSLILLDLDGTRTQPFEVLRQLGSDSELRSVPTLGFVSHVHAAATRRRRRSESGVSWLEVPSSPN